MGLTGRAGVPVCVALGCEQDSFLMWRTAVRHGEAEWSEDLPLCEHHGDMLAVGFELKREGRCNSPYKAMAKS